MTGHQTGDSRKRAAEVGEVEAWYDSGDVPLPRRKADEVLRCFTDASLADRLAEARAEGAQAVAERIALAIEGLRPTTLTNAQDDLLDVCADLARAAATALGVTDE